MNILIPSTYELDFVYKIIAKFIDDIKLKLLTTDFRLLDMWLQVEFGLDSKVSCKKIIEYAFNHIEIITHNTNYQIHFNPLTHYPGTATRLITLLKTINYGNRHFNGIPILSDEFEQLNMNLDNLYEQYRFIGVVL